MSKKILVITGDFVEDYEIMVPFQTLLTVGYEVDVVSSGKKEGEQIRTAIHDFEGDQTYTEKPGHNFTLNASFDEIDVNSYDGLFISGGRAPEHIRLDEKVMSKVQHFIDSNKPIASVCHGILVLAATNALKGKTASCYPACSHDVSLAGGKWIDVGYDGVHTDGNLITAAAWPAHPALLSAFIKKLS
jgi:protease I